MVIYDFTFDFYTQVKYVTNSFFMGDVLSCFVVYPRVSRRFVIFSLIIETYGSVILNLFSLLDQGKGLILD